ncbi:MAG: pectate lyase [Alteromonadaceae bacterium]|jgi:pectate lyase|uniref:pectate lyase family protein n=1 Tax=Rheinheimera aquimaris TaxID=412437 RepID=UPI000C4CECFC|nr:pectate lyase [Rheinheimera aquimaris]MBJ92255.1 pectate lyase [Alteromonadaceae bacterium]|tara:strand:- start:10505 stop:12481 length:1977 start_codon:yes stop_codon:yes gene_type:complete
MFNKTLLAMLVGSALLLGCNSSNDDPATVPDTGIETPTPEPDTGVIALTDLDTVYGYASENGGTTGGSGENKVEITVCTGEEMINAIKNKDPSRPLTIWVNGSITLQNAKDSRIDIKDVSDVSIIGLGNQGEMAGIGFNIVRAENIIIRNLRIHHVRANLGAPGDGISIEGPVRNIWIDHNEIYNSLTVADPSLTEDQVKDYYDGLVDAKGDAQFITISFNKLHHSWKTSLVGSSDSDNYDRTITYHHNHWYNVNSRLPLFRFGKGHIYNNFYDGAVESGINSRMGAVIRIEHNHFASMKNPVMSMYSQEPGFWQLIDNIFDDITWQESPDDGVVAGEAAESTGELTPPYDYSASLLPVHNVKATVLAYAGTGKIDTPPSPGLCASPEPAEPEPTEPEPVPIDPVEPPANVDWNSYDGSLQPFADNALTLADGSLSKFEPQQSGGADEPNLFSANGDGTIRFDSTANSADRSRAKLSAVAPDAGVYPKFFTLLMGVTGNSSGNRILETEVALGDANAVAASRLKIILRNDGNNSGIQLENANNGSSVTAGKGNEPDALDMSAYRIYHFTVALSSPTTGNVAIYTDGNNTPLLQLEGVTMRPASNGSDNYLQIGDAGGSSYLGDIDWVLWSSAGAYTPNMLKGLLPAGVGNISGYEAQP